MNTNTDNSSLISFTTLNAAFAETVAEISFDANMPVDQTNADWFTDMGNDLEDFDSEA